MVFAPNPRARDRPNTELGVRFLAPTVAQAIAVGARPHGLDLLVRELRGVVGVRVEYGQGVHGVY